MRRSHACAGVLGGIFAALLGLVGCTNKNASQSQQTQPQPTTNAFNGGTISGFHANATKTTTSRKFSLVPPVYAQTTSTITLTGAYSGYTANFEGAESQGQGVAIAQGSVPIAYPIYGVGTLSPNCAPGGNSLLNCPFAAGAGSMSASQALASQVSASTAIQGKLAPAFVAGGGTIGPMVAFGYAINGTIPSGPTANDLVEVWVIRNGQVLSTGVSCGLPVQSNSATLQVQRCESSATFNVQDSDGIVATVTLNPADQLSAMNFFLVKN
jgi:hypothetical protein